MTVFSLFMCNFRLPALVSKVLLSREKSLERGKNVKMSTIKSIKQKSYLIATTKHQKKKAILGQQVQIIHNSVSGVKATGINKVRVLSNLF